MVASHNSFSKSVLLTNNTSKLRNVVYTPSCSSLTHNNNWTFFQIVFNDFSYSIASIRQNISYLNLKTFFHISSRHQLNFPPSVKFYKLFCFLIPFHYGFVDFFSDIVCKFAIIQADCKSNLLQPFYSYKRNPIYEIL